MGISLCHLDGGVSQEFLEGIDVNLTGTCKIAGIGVTQIMKPESGHSSTFADFHPSIAESMVEFPGIVGKT